MNYLNKFWFEKQTTETLALFRIVFGFYILLILIISAPSWQHFYASDGLFPVSVLKQSKLNYWTLFSLHPSDFYLWSFYIFFVLVTLCFSYGFFTRFSTIALYACYFSINSRNFIIGSGQDIIATMLLFFCCFSSLGSFCSLDQKFRNKNKLSVKQKYEVWPLRLLQISFLMIYLVTGLEKIPHWKAADIMYYISLDPRWFRFTEAEIFKIPLVFKFLTYSTLVIEISFPFLVWIKALRPYLLILMGLFHIALIVLMTSGVFYFNLIMLVGLLLFLDNNTASKVLAPINRLLANR